MNIWIITTGSSDVQLKTDKNWQHTHRKIRLKKYSNHNFVPERPKYADENEPFQVAARVMGIVYGEYLIDKHYDDLCFPIFDTLSTKLQILGTLPDKIIIIFTDQSKIFERPDQKSKECPFWQDTCTLEPIITKYFKTKFPDAKQLEHKYLTPTFKKEGLDNWDSTLTLVKDSLSDIEVGENSTVYVSHQAGTPAISSAIQFMTLAKFGNQVQFLVSNEYDKNIAYAIPSPKYLWAMKLQEATTLLERYDYDGVTDILKPYLRQSNDSIATKINRLLKIAIQWNYANFEKFADGFPKVMGDVNKERFQKWWWTAYEAAYLAVVRLEQGNTVEAFFHSFRAVEGLIFNWIAQNYSKYMSTDGRSISHPDDSKPYNLYGKHLYRFLLQRNSKSLVGDIKAFGDAFSERNNRFHKLYGLQKDKLFEIWKTQDSREWQNRILNCLNFVSGENFTDLKDASLMSQVHEELRNTLKSYQP